MNYYIVSLGTEVFFFLFNWLFFQRSHYRDKSAKVFSLYWSLIVINNQCDQLSNYRFAYIKEVMVICILSKC